MYLRMYIIVMYVQRYNAVWEMKRGVAAMGEGGGGLVVFCERAVC